MLSAAVNGVTLLVVAAVVLVESIKRLVDPSDVAGTPLVVVASLGLVVSLVATLVLSGADRQSLNIAGAFAHVATDAASFAATIVAGVVVLADRRRPGRPDRRAVRRRTDVACGRGRCYATPVTSCSRVRPPTSTSPSCARICCETSYVVDVHDLHAWTSGSRLPSVSAHVVVDDACFADGRAPQLLDELQACLAGHFDVEHSTFQLEPASHAAHEAGMH